MSELHERRSVVIGMKDGITDSGAFTGGESEQAEVVLIVGDFWCFIALHVRHQYKLGMQKVVLRAAATFRNDGRYREDTPH